MMMMDRQQLKVKGQMVTILAKIYFCILDVKGTEKYYFCILDFKGTKKNKVFVDRRGPALPLTIKKKKKKKKKKKRKWTNIVEERVKGLGKFQEVKCLVINWFGGGVRFPKIGVHE